MEGDFACRWVGDSYFTTNLAVATENNHYLNGLGNLPSYLSCLLVLSCLPPPLPTPNYFTLSRQTDWLVVAPRAPSVLHWHVHLRVHMSSKCAVHLHHIVLPEHTLGAVSHIVMYMYAGAMPEEATTEGEGNGCGDFVYEWMSDYHPDGGQLFWPHTPMAFVVWCVRSIATIRNLGIWVHSVLAD